MATYAYITGHNDIKINLHLATAKMGEGLNRGLKKAAEYLLRRSLEIVPVDTGDLYRSAFIEETGRGASYRVFIGYAMHYAVYVHENLANRHAPGKSAKFLEYPMNDPNIRKYMFTIVYREMAKAR